MVRFLKWCWGNPLPFRLAASAFFGILLGFLFVGKPVWIVVFVLILIFRTHIPTVIISALFGYLLSLPVRQFYERIGIEILVSKPFFWQNFCSKRFINYLNLNNAQIIGSITLGLLFSFIFFLVLIVFLKKSKNPLIH